MAMHSLSSDQRILFMTWHMRRSREVRESSFLKRGLDKGETINNNRSHALKNNSFSFDSTVLDAGYLARLTGEPECLGATPGWRAGWKMLMLQLAAILL
jgi:hypothetical protein